MPAKASTDCNKCGRKISDWVKELGYTLGHRKANYCRFCYLKLRNSGVLKARRDDDEFLAAINWELELIESKRKKDSTRLHGECPECEARLTYNLKSNKSAVGICPGCAAHIRLTENGIKIVSDRSTVILNAARRLGDRPDYVLRIYECIVDEIAAKIAQDPIFSLPSIGAFVHKKTNSGAEILFKPSKKLLQRFKNANHSVREKSGQ